MTDPVTPAPAPGVPGVPALSADALATIAAHRAEERRRWELDAPHRAAVAAAREERRRRAEERGAPAPDHDLDYLLSH